MNPQKKQKLMNMSSHFEGNGLHLKRDVQDASTNTPIDYHNDLELAEDTIVNMLNEIQRRDVYIQRLERDYEDIKNKIVEQFLSS